MDQPQEKIDSGAAGQPPAIEEHRCKSNSNTIAYPNVGRVKHTAQPGISRRPVDFLAVLTEVVRPDGFVAWRSNTRPSNPVQQLERVFAHILCQSFS